MKKWMRTVLACILCAVFLGSLGVMLHRNQDYQTGQDSYQTATQTAGIQTAVTPSAEDTSASLIQTPAPQPNPDAPFAPELEPLWNLNLSALREVNGDVLGWILLPGTPISYPLVQGEDNDYYLNRTWDNKRSSVGAIFLECRNSPDLSDFNTIIYGHRMGNGTMFHSLHEYQSRDYWQAHPMVYLADGTGVWRYEIFAAYEVAVDQSTYRLLFPDNEIKQTFLDECTARGVYDTGIVPTTEDKILTLSTCTGNGHATRWVVQAVRTGEAARP